MTKFLHTALAAALAVILVGTAPAHAAVGTPDDTPQGNANATLGAQLTSGDGMLASLRFMGSLNGAELAATLMAPPGNPLGFFTVDSYLAFVGQTGSFLPINLRPVMGVGLAGGFRDVPNRTGTGTTTDLNMWMYMPVGLRYVLGVRGMALGVEALYHLPALYFMKGVTDPARWHFELNGRAGALTGGVYYELGAVYNGPGARVGLVF